MLNLRNIEEKDYVKYLGIYIDKNLNWNPFRLRHFLTLNTLKQIYNSLI